MTSLPYPTEKSDLQLENDLVQLELRIARRADELSQRHEHDRAKDRDDWQQAEREVLGLMLEPGRR
ncbi:MAG TPA: hypothetical protein VGD81_18120 [Opitutaceae bacterium]